MDEQRKNNRSLLAAGAAALTVVVALVLVFVLSGRDSGREQIVLPDPPAAVETPAEEAVPDEGFAEVTPENVQNIIARLARPASYHQTLTITTISDDVSRQQVADLWRSGDLLMAQIIDEDMTRCVLTDGQTLYLWYGGQEGVRELRLDQGMDYDDLVGVPTYEDVAQIPSRLISQAAYTTGAQPGEPQCVALTYRQNSLTQELRISLDSGLLYAQTAYDGESPVYVLQQTFLEVLMDEDEALSDVFSLPDGSQPFAD